MVKAAIARFHRIPLAVADLNSLVVECSLWVMREAAAMRSVQLLVILSKDVLHLDVRVDVHPLRRQLPLCAGV